MCIEYLQKGDSVAIVGTAKHVDKEAICFASELLQSWGFEVVLGRSLFKKDFVFAGTGKERLIDLQEALDNPEIKAILCARGGYGTVRLIDQVDFSSFLRKPKWILGFSDITVLHSHIQANYELPTAHTTMPALYHKNTRETLESIRQFLLGESFFYTFSTSSYNRSGEVSGKIVGGNLSIITSLLGSNSDIDTRNKILFLEEVDEYLYHIDRMIISLKRAGKFDHLIGLLVGGFTDMKDNPHPFGKTAEEIIIEHTLEYSFPIAFGAPFGHLNDNRLLALGKQANLHIDSQTTTLTFEK